MLKFLSNTLFWSTKLLSEVLTFAAMFYGFQVLVSIAALYLTGPQLLIALVTVWGIFLTQLLYSLSFASDKQPIKLIIQPTAEPEQTATHTEPTATVAPALV
ncbi:MAG: hypothetical protein AAGF24_10880 [Cyanobacteria bacterium P01_H01_bin.121]